MSEGLGSPRPRRRALGWLLAGWLLFAMAGTTAAAATVRFFYPAVTFEPAQLVTLGTPSQLELGVSERFS